MNIRHKDVFQNISALRETQHMCQMIADSPEREAPHHNIAHEIQHQT